MTNQILSSTDLMMDEDLKNIDIRFTVKQFDLSIFKANNTEFIEKLRDSVCQSLKIDKNSLNKYHKQTSLGRINSARIDCFNKINRLTDWKHGIAKTISPHIQYLLGHDLAIQRQMNISIQAPNDSSSILEPHQDYRSGDSPFQKVIWIPMTGCKESNSLFLENRDGRFEPIECDFGDIIIFDPNTIHGNILNKTDNTRVSINFRIKNWFTPDLGEQVPDRQFGIYYEDFIFSRSTLRAFNLLKESI